MTDIGLHVTEAMVLTDITGELIRGPVGRKRPRVANGDAFVFQFERFTNFENRAFVAHRSGIRNVFGDRRDMGTRSGRRDC